MPEKFNLKTFFAALSIVVVVLVFGFISVVVFLPTTAVHDHRAEEALIKKHWPAAKQ